MKFRLLGAMGAEERQRSLAAIDQLNQRESSSVTIANDPRLLADVMGTFGYATDMAIFEAEGAVVGYFMFALVGRRIVSLPHFSYAGFLAEPAHHAAVQECLLGFLLQQGAHYLVRTQLTGAAFHYDGKCSYQLPLPDRAESLLKGFKSKLRSQIKRAGSHGIEIQRGGVELCDDFFEVYSRNMLRLGSPCLPRLLFRQLLESAVAGDRRVYLAKLGGTTIGVAFVVEYLGFCEVCWASTLKEYNKLSPNMLVYWAMMEDAVARGCRVFSFGRSSRGASTEKFKLQWDPDTVVLNWSSDAQMGGDGRVTHLLSSIWKWLPYRVTLPLGERITHYIC